mgnify:CR=1 FL=1
MPKSGNSGARAAGGAAGRKPRHGKSEASKKHGVAGSKANPAANGKFKPREDGRGGRSPQRQAFFEERVDREAAPRGERFERDDRPRGGFNRDDRPTRDDRGGRGGFNRDDRPARGGFNRDDRPARGDRFERDGDSRPGSGRPERRREWTPVEDRPGRGRKFAVDRGDRPARDDRPRGDRFERDDRPRGDRFERDDRPARGGFNRDDRGGRGRFERDDRPRGGFNRDDRPRRFDRDDSTDRNGQRPDRLERDRSRERSFEGRRDSNPNKKAFFEDAVLERLESADATEVVIAERFDGMGLHPRLVAALENMGAETPFPIQAATIPAAIEGRDVLGRGKTGSGKTIAFSVPIISKLANGGSKPRIPNKPRAVILAPTRELADQIDRTASQLARSVGFYTTTVYGGVPQRRQEIALSRGVDILVATPGRLEDLMAQRIVDLSEVETMVIDEADHMCDLGFIDGVRRIMAATGDSQKLLFSATLDREVDALVKEFMPNPFVYEVPNEVNDTQNIEHRVMVLRDEDRSGVVLRLVQGAGKALIFTRTKATAESLSESLTEAGVPAARLHGDLNQNQRNRNLERFIRGNTRVLVATDVAARGIHVDDVALVIQLDPPMEYKTYLHRAGRTGRAGKHGVVVTLIPRQRRRRMEDLLHRAERDAIFTDVWPSHELLEQLAGPIAPPPQTDTLDFGGGRGQGGREGRDDRGGRGGRDRGGRGYDRPRGGFNRDDRPKRPYQGKRERD